MRSNDLDQKEIKTGNSWAQRMAISALNRYSASGKSWHYTDGLLFKGMQHLWERTGESYYWESLADYVNHFVTSSGTIKTYKLEEFNIDQINPGKLLFPLYAATGEKRYQQALALLYEQLKRHPRTNEGGFWHKQIYPYQMWLDGIYMGTAFYAQYAAVFNKPDDFDDIAFQITTIEKHTRDPKTGLLYHAWDESREMPWADPGTGCSSYFWSRAVGWYVMAIVDILEFFPEEHKDRGELISILNRTFEAVCKVQDNDTGLWWQVMDQGNRSGNYLESSGTCMFIYSIAKGIRTGCLNAELLPVADKAFQGLIEHLITIDDEGQLNLHGICCSAGLGGTPYRDGSYEYYIGEPIVSNNLHGVAAFILAANELELITSL